MRFNVFCDSEVGNKTETAHRSGKNDPYCVTGALRTLDCGLYCSGLVTEQKQKDLLTTMVFCPGKFSL